MDRVGVPHTRDACRISTSSLRHTSMTLPADSLSTDAYARPQVPRLTCADAQRVAAENFGVQGKVSALASHIDQNFRVKPTDGGPAWVQIGRAGRRPGLGVDRAGGAAARPGCGPGVRGGGSGWVWIERAGRRPGII